MQLAHGNWATGDTHRLVNKAIHHWLCARCRKTLEELECFASVLCRLEAFLLNKLKVARLMS